MSSSLPCNIEYTLSIIAKNIFMKTDVKNIDVEAIARGEPIQLPAFKILDVGCGFGKWGFLIRDTFDVMIGQNFTKESWRIDITGVEPFDRCVTPLQEIIYNRIVKRDILSIVDELDEYDLIILGDVIEHFEKPKAQTLLQKLFEHSENIIVSTPKGFMPQGAWAGNERETHRSGWEIGDFAQHSIIEHRILQDQVFHSIYRQIPGLQQEMTKQTELLVIWLRK